MISISTVNDALKSFYLDVVIHQLNNSMGHLYKQFKATEQYIQGKRAVRPVCYGLSSGIAAVDETDALPTANGNKYILLNSDLRNLYGTIEISDKALRASENREGAVVNLLNAEMEGLLASAKMNFSRMLYGNGSARVASVATAVTTASTTLTVDDLRFLEVGMNIKLIDNTRTNTVNITAINSSLMQITVDTAVSADAGANIYMVASLNNEINGLETFFEKPGTLYGVSTVGKDWLKPYVGAGTGSISDIKIQTAIDNAESASGGRIDFISCSYGVRRAYQEYLETTKRNISPMELEGGFKTIGFAGIPVVADRFCPYNTMYLLDTKLYDLHQLCDWSWLEGDTGSVLKQISGKAAYSATLVKYANLMCFLPCGQAKLAGVTEK